MPDFEIDDLVRVVSVPDTGFYPDIVDKVGFIERIDLDLGMASVQLITLDGGFCCGGGIDLDRLEPVDDPVWVAAKGRFDAMIEENMRVAQARTASWREHLTLVAAKHGLRRSVIEEIYEDCREWEGWDVC